MQSVGSQDRMTGAIYGTGGGVLYNPQTGTTSDACAPDRPPNPGYNVGGLVVLIRRVQK